MTFHPMATSTPICSDEHDASLSRPLSEQANNHLSPRHSSKICGSTIFSQPPLVDIQQDEPPCNLSIRIASDDLLSTLNSTLQGKSGISKRNKTFQSGKSIGENEERLNRLNFFLKNVATSLTYMDVFVSIVSRYPLVQMNTTGNQPKVQYLCVAGNILARTNDGRRPPILEIPTSSNEKSVSIHLCFQNKVNFKHKFLNHLFPGRS